MADVAVFHPHLPSKGGGEAVCMNVLQTLQDDHDVTLVTVTDPDIAVLNDHFDVAVHDVTVDRVEPVGPALARLVNLLDIPSTGPGLWTLAGSILKRRWDSDRHDLVVSTYNEFTFSPPAIQYIHHPNVAADRRSLPAWGYARCREAVDGFDRDVIRSTTLLANSAWTATVAEAEYGRRPTVLNPPADVAAFADARRPWDEREDGVVSIGRITASKNTLRVIETVEAVRSRGYDLHLHLVGPLDGTRYSREVERVARQWEWISLEGSVSRERVLELVGTHRYGLHAKENEHFGMAVAELLAGGTIPFAHDTGGQREVLDERPDLLYDDAAEAVELLTAVVADPQRQADVRSALDGLAERYGRERFRTRIRRTVDDVLDRENATG